MPGSGWEALLYVREWSVSPPGCKGVVERPYRMFGSGPDTLRDVRQNLPNVQKNLWDIRKWSGGSPESPGVV